MVKGYKINYAFPSAIALCAPLTVSDLIIASVEAAQTPVEKVIFAASAAQPPVQPPA
jgi:hypothetical protein